MEHRSSEAASLTDRPDEAIWFDDVHNIDDEWVEVGVKTNIGNYVRYRVPRRTGFDKVDQAAR